MKKLVKLLLVMLFIVNTINVVKAEDLEKSIIEDNFIFEFDLTKPYQEYSFIDEKGLITTISIESISSVSGEKLVSATNAEVSMSYKVYISNNKIINAYDKSCSSNLWTITSDVLVKNSDYKATYTVTLKKLFTTTRSLIATMNNGNLSITYN